MNKFDSREDCSINVLGPYLCYGPFGRSRLCAKAVGSETLRTEFGQIFLRRMQPVTIATNLQSHPDDSAKKHLDASAGESNFEMFNFFPVGSTSI